MNLLQSIYDGIRNWKQPSWLRIMLQEVQNILLSILVSVGKEYIRQMEDKIIKTASLNMSNKEKFQIVFNFGKSLLPAIKDSTLNLLIEALVNRLKQTGFARTV